jgi:hypothetical protein
LTDRSSFGESPRELLPVRARAIKSRPINTRDAAVSINRDSQAKYAGVAIAIAIGKSAETSPVDTDRKNMKITARTVRIIRKKRGVVRCMWPYGDAVQNYSVASKVLE